MDTLYNGRPVQWTPCAMDTLYNGHPGNLKTIQELVSNWDNLKIPDALFDVVGCFICALDERVNIGPNKNNFFKDPTEHRKTFHAEKVFAELTRKQKENLRLIQKLLVSDGAEAEPMMTVTTPQIPTKDAPASSTSSSSSSQQTIWTDLNWKIWPQKQVSVCGCHLHREVEGQSEMYQWPSKDGKGILLICNP